MVLTGSDAVDVVAEPAVATVGEDTVLVLHELLEAIASQQLVLLMVALVLL